MKNLLLRILLIGNLLGFSFSLLAQETVISGKVTDGETGEGMPFVNVFFKGTNQGTSTDFDGFFKISSKSPTDSLVASYIGYEVKAKPVQKGTTQQISFQLTPLAQTLNAIDIVYGDYENPAWEILRNVILNREQHDKRRLDAYAYESYTKVEIDMDNISEKFRNRKIIQKITAVMDSIDQIAGEDGKPVLPVFISETLSNFYYLKNPTRKREDILKTKVTGIGVSDGTTVSQLVGSSFQEYNFYNNWMKILEKDFVSPIAESWKLFYDYDLAEKMEKVDGINCYRIDFQPKRPEDLAFSGSMWITDSTYQYALKQIDVRVDKAANLNFVEKLKIQQTLEPTDSAQAWLPSKTRVLVDIGEIKQGWAGMLAKFYVSNKDFVINQPEPPKFFDQEVVVAEDALMGNTETFWAEHRHDSLTQTEINVYSMIDTVRNLPMVKSYVDIANILFVGYKTIGKIDVGTYSYLYAFNDVEGHRFRLGARTNIDFSKKFVFRGRLAYGTRDQEFKYLLEGNYILSRKPWTMIGLSHSRELEQVGIYNEAVSNSVLFDAAFRWGTLLRPFRHTVNKAWFSTYITPELRQTITFKNRFFDPLFNFSYLQPGAEGVVKNNFTVSEVDYELRLAFQEKFLQNDNERISLGTNGRPVITARYTYGIDSFLGSDFSYHKITLGFDHGFRLGLWGRTSYKLMGGYIPSQVPYPLLETHLGNQSIFVNEVSFNMMNFFEFVSDQWVSLRATHRFEGFLMNRVPLFRKLKWRLLATTNILYGSVRQENFDIIPETGTDGLPIPLFNALGREPYVEVGYGIENIFRLFRVDFLHRLNYLDGGANRFGVKFTTQFRL